MAGDRIAETHVSRLVFVGDHVFKAKKPVHLGFVDLRPLEARMQACHEEVRLNRRLAPDVYEGVGIFRFPDGREEPVVVMRRLPADRALSGLVRTNAPHLREYVSAIAETVAKFHQHADRSAAIDRCATPAAVRGLWEGNLAELSEVWTPPLDPSVLDDVEASSTTFLAGRSDLFEERIAAGRIVDGHGDLLADDIFFPDERPRIIDCLEYRADFRQADTLLDVAFLAMDLERLGRPDLAAGFIEEYRRCSGDSWPDSLLHFYVAYRASIRAKVACLQARADEASVLMALCSDHLRSTSIRLVLVGGLPGTGKSTLAAGIGSATGWEVLSTDATRKQLAGRAASSDATSGWESGLYTPDVTAAVYRELLSQAEARLRRGRSVILDGTWSRRPWRDAAAEVAAATSSDLVELRCQLSLPVSEQRIRARLAAGDHRSDATPEIARAMATAADPWPEAVTVDTSADPGDAVALALGIVAGPRRNW